MPPPSRRARGTRIVVQFAMPPEWTLDTLPEPTDPAVSLRAVPARTVAVIRYSGTWSQDATLSTLRNSRTRWRERA